MRAEIRPEGAPDQLCSAYLKAEWQLELGNPFNVVLMGTSGSRFPYSAVHVRRYPDRQGCSRGGRWSALTGKALRHHVSIAPCSLRVL
jgi:hypothetical protein